jgi:hypothetical protein
MKGLKVVLVPGNARAIESLGGGQPGDKGLSLHSAGGWNETLPARGKAVKLSCMSKPTATGASHPVPFWRTTYVVILPCVILNKKEGDFILLEFLK